MPRTCKIEKKIHSCWKCQHSTCWWKIYFILNILQYWMIKREKNRGIEFCIMSVQHTGNKINKESKPKLQFHLNKCLPCLPGRLGPHGWELVWWCWTPVNKYIQVSGQRRTAPTMCAGGCSRYVWKIDSCTINESTAACMVPAEIPHRVLSAASTDTRTKVLLLHSAVGSQVILRQSWVWRHWQTTLQETTVTSKALVEGKSWGCWGSHLQHCVQSSCYTDKHMPEEQTPP